MGICSMARLQRTLRSVMSWPFSLHQSAASLLAFLEKYIKFLLPNVFGSEEGIVHYPYPDGSDDKVSCYCQKNAENDAIHSE